MGKRKLKNYLYLAPAFVIFCAVVIFPTVYSVYLSFFSWNGVKPKELVGLKNYINLFTADKVFKTALLNNIKWLLLTMIFTVAVSLLLAVMLNRQFKGRTFFRAVFYFPYMLSWIVAGLVWQWIFNPSAGFLAQIYDLFGWERGNVIWLSNPKTALFFVFIAALWQGTGQPMILFLSGLQTIPNDVLEAAKIDGANNIQAFFRVTIPMLKETFVVVFATLIIASLKVYDIIKVMTGGGPNDATQTLATYMYSQTFRYSNLGMGSAVATIMLLIMMFIIIPYVSYTAKDE